MQLSPQLAKRVLRELKVKYITTEDGDKTKTASEYCANRLDEMCQMLSDSITIAGDFVITLEDIASLSTDLAVMKVSDPEGYAEVKAFLGDPPDLERCEGDFVANFEVAFREYWLQQGLRRATIEHILAERQGAALT